MCASPVIQTLSGLVRINSVNPAFQDGNPESEIVAFVEQFFEQRGIETRRQAVWPDRPNLIARLPGRQASRRVVFEAHCDTASITGMTIPPFEPSISGGLLYGRGSCDTKAGLAGMMEALASLKKEGIVPPCEIWVVAAADEEYSFQGATELCRGLSATAAVVSEPTDLRLVIASKGCLRWSIVSKGKAAHSSKPHLGINAISNMTHIIQALEQDAERLMQRQHPLVGGPTCNVGLIRGGVQVNFVPDSCVIEVDRRLIPGEKPSEVFAHYQAVLDDLKKIHPTLECVMEPPRLEAMPLETAATAAPAVLASQILTGMKLNPEPAGVPYGSDASVFSRASIPAILFGPGSIDQAHGAVEYVDCSQVEQSVEFYRQFMLNFE